MFAIIDIETTGLDPKQEKITEIAILIHDGVSVVEQFSSLVNPGKSIPATISRITGITNEMVMDAPKFYQIANVINDLTRNKIFVAHNVKFDYGFVVEEFKSFGYAYKREQLCTVRLSKKLLPGRSSYSLGQLCKSLKINLSNHHRALADASATAELFNHLLYLKNNSKFKSQDLQALNTGRLDKIQQYILAKLPESTGIYYFLNRDEEILYIGKSKNIRQRAISHFNSDEKKIKQLLNETYNIRFEETGSELIALLMESEEIKKHKPRYNKSLRLDFFSYVIEAEKDQKGLIHFKISPSEEARSAAQAGTQPLLYFHTFASAKSKLREWIDRYELCPYVCGVEPEKGACFNFQIKKCKGICCGEESVEQYNSRVEILLQKINMLPDYLLIEEAGRVEVEKSFILIHQHHFAGFGYIHHEFKADHVKDYLERIIPFTYYPDMDDLIRSYLKKKIVLED